MLHCFIDNLITEGTLYKGISVKRHTAKRHAAKRHTLVSRINVQSLINVHSGISSNDSRRACLKMFPYKRA